MYLQQEHKVWLATGQERVYLEPSMANRHGLIAGATGTGKTVTLKVLAESFSDMGVPLFVADVKGDLSGMCVVGEENKHIRRSIDTMGLGDFQYRPYPVRFWDVYGKKGIPVRTTVSEMGPELLSRLLGQEVELNASGRTDAGVHAREQVCSFRAETDLDCAALLRNGMTTDI